MPRLKASRRRARREQREREVHKQVSKGAREGVCEGESEEMVDKIEKAGLDKNEQRYIIILDVYSVHRSVEFLEWWRGSGMGKQGLLIFVPANYTGQLQPLDVAFNGPFKAILRRAMQSWLSEIVARKFADGLGPGALNLKEEFKLTNLKAPFCAAMDEALRYFLTEKGQNLILRGFREAGVLDCFGDGSRALYEKAVAANEEGTLFPGGKNQNIDAMIDSTIASIPANTPEDFVPSETDEVANWMLDLFAAEPGAIEAVEGCED